MKRRGMLAPIAVAAAVIAMTAGCSASGGTSSDGGNNGRDSGAVAAKDAAAAPLMPPAVPTTGLTRGMSLPLEAYEETLPEYNEILKARFAIESACMRGYGFSFKPAADTDTISYDASNMGRRYGLSDPAAAAQYGYSVPNFAHPAPSDPALTRQEYVVLTGGLAPGGAPSPTPGSYNGKPVPAGGCVGEADRQLTDPANDMLVNTLDQQSLDDSQALPAVKAAISQWSDCMRQSGYQAADPLKASLLTQQLKATVGDPVDRKIAVADVTCKTHTNLVGIWFAAESTLQQQYIAAHAAQLRQDAATLTAARDKAEAVLAADGG